MKIIYFEIGLFFLNSRDNPCSTAKPIITLYTKDPCPLCDDLVMELYCNFEGEFELEKVDITEKGNLKFLRLYRNDIPVVFLNGQYLCMHRLDHGLLRRKLDEIKNSN